SLPSAKSLRPAVDDGFEIAAGKSAMGDQDEQLRGALKQVLVARPGAPFPRAFLHSKQ
ncbi:MAG: hypothetical protein ACI9KE_006458, partial [Polyangiales bacterium]